MNEDLNARIKQEKDSDYFEVEESIRQGSGLSAILYAQQAAKVMEELEDTKGRGKRFLRLDGKIISPF